MVINSVLFYSIHAMPCRITIKRICVVMIFMAGNSNDQYKSR